jgi:hypothetical protein
LVVEEGSRPEQAGARKHETHSEERQSKHSQGARVRARHSSPAAPRSHASPASSRHSHFPMALAAEVCAASRIAENPSVLFLLDFFPTICTKSGVDPGSLQLITQVGRGWIVGQSVVALRWNWIWVCQTHRRPAAGSSSVSARSSPYSWYGIAASAFCWRRKCPPRQRTAQCRPIRHEGASAARRLCLARAFASTGCG